MLVVNAILPIFIIILLGYCSEKFHILGRQGAYVLNRFVLFFGLPLLVFTSLENLKLTTVFNFGFIASFSLGMIISFLLLTHLTHRS